MAEERFAERNAEIRRRRLDGQGPLQIAREMGVSSNAVLGVCYRAGLSSAEPRPARSASVKEQSTSGAGLRGALGLAQAQDSGRADLRLRRFSWQDA